MTDTPLATLTEQAPRQREPQQVLEDAAVLLQAAGFRLERSATSLEATRVGTRRKHESWLRLGTRVRVACDGSAVVASVTLGRSETSALKYWFVPWGLMLVGVGTLIAGTRFHLDWPTPDIAFQVGFATLFGGIFVEKWTRRPLLVRPALRELVQTIG